MLSDLLQKKFAKLREILRPHLAEGLIIAFSGGVDSAFLLWTAEQVRCTNGGRLLALTTESASFSDAEKRDAMAFAKKINVEHRFEKSLELENPEYAKNDAKRCYHCKTELFRIGHKVAVTSEYKHIAYGFNASDRADFRPGQIAAEENEILAPLNEAELTKDEIRNLMREFKLDLAEKPSSPCLSSRLMTGVSVTKEKLRDIEDFEMILRTGGLRVFRVRLHEENERRFLRLEVATEEMLKAFEVRETLVNEAKTRGYLWVTLDLAGYKTGGANLINKQLKAEILRN